MKYILKVFPTYTKEILVATGVLIVLLIVQMLKGDEVEIIHQLDRPEFYENEKAYRLYYEEKDESVYTVEINVRPKEPTSEEINIYLLEQQKIFEREFQRKFNQEEEEALDEGVFLKGPIELKQRYGECEVELYVEHVVGIDDTGWINPDYIEKKQVIPYSIQYRKVIKQGTVELYIHSKKVQKNYSYLYNKYKIEKEINRLEEDIDRNTVQLPQENVVFYQKYLPRQSGKNIGLLVVMLLSFSLLSHYEARHQKEILEKEKRIQLMYFLNNFLLMFHSGLTIQKSFYLSIDNRMNTLDKSSKLAPYFEKWQGMVRQERNFYDLVEDFQKCFSLVEGRRFCRLIVQNLRQGDHHLTLQLTTLSESMLEQRIRHARKESEKASSKLVFPMLIIFIIILMITIVPSFMEVNMV